MNDIKIYEKYMDGCDCIKVYNALHNNTDDLPNILVSYKPSFLVPVIIASYMSESTVNYDKIIQQFNVILNIESVFKKSSQVIINGFDEAIVIADVNIIASSESENFVVQIKTKVSNTEIKDWEIVHELRTQADIDNFCKDCCDYAAEIKDQLQIKKDFYMYITKIIDILTAMNVGESTYRLLKIGTAEDIIIATLSTQFIFNDICNICELFNREIKLSLFYSAFVLDNGLGGIKISVEDKGINKNKISESYENNDITELINLSRKIGAELKDRLFFQNNIN